MAKATKNNSVATQTFTTEKECKHVIRFAPEGKADVGGQAVDELSSSIYVSKTVLALLGNPEKITVSVAAQ